MSNKKFNIKLFNKITLTIFGAAAIITPIAYFATARGALPLLTAAGSSAVFPLMKAFAEEYNEADITVQAGGSGVGIQSILNANKTFGMASKDPSSDFEKNQTKWTERKIKTVTVAWDGLGLVYRDESDSNDLINLTSDSIKNVYKAFDGHAEVKYSDLGLIGNDTIITPFARTGGADASGTADSFLKASNLLEGNEQDEIKNAYPSLQNGNYGSHTKQTPESNSQALQQVLASTEPGAMVYLSAGFIMNNKPVLENEGFKVATYNDISIFAKKITDGYNWFRPLNVLFSLDNPIQQIKDFVEWMVFESKSQEILVEEGFIALSEWQKDTMTKELDFFVTDVDLGRTGALAKEPTSSILNSSKLWQNKKLDWNDNLIFNKQETLE